MTDAINPTHYRKTGQMEVIDQMMNLYGSYAVKHFCICNAFKYRMRAGLKEGQLVEQDIAKARWYEAMVLFIEGKGKDPREAAY
jgi:hypothetical protein